MMTNELFLKIVELIITVLMIIITTYVLPWVKSKLTSEQMKQLESYAEIGVRCAEQIFSAEQFVEKKEYVMNYVLDAVNSKLKISISQEDINNLIEATVNKVKYGSDYTR